MSRQVAVLTGAASGIGRHFAEVLARRPDDYLLALADLDFDGLRSTFEARDGLELHRLDIRSLDDWHRVVDDTLRRFDRIDLLLNIAGGGRPGFLLDQPVDTIDRTIDINLKGALYGMKLVAEQMVRQGSGHIINMASLAGISPTPGNALYSAAKSGLRAASIAAAIELRRHGVYVTVICPDVVDTPLAQRHLDLGEEVALIYTGSRTLTVADVERALFIALEERPLEVNIPRGRGRLAKLASALPGLALRLNRTLTRKGMKRLERLRRQRDLNRS